MRNVQFSFAPSRSQPRMGDGRWDPIMCPILSDRTPCFFKCALAVVSQPADHLHLMIRRHLFIAQRIKDAGGDFQFGDFFVLIARVGSEQGRGKAGVRCGVGGVASTLTQMG